MRDERRHLLENEKRRRLRYLFHKQYIARLRDEDREFSFAE